MSQKYFALTQETLQEVLLYLTKDPAAELYRKVSQALPVVSAPPVVEKPAEEVPTT